MAGPDQFVDTAPYRARPTVEMTPTMRLARRSLIIPVLLAAVAVAGCSLTGSSDDGLTGKTWQWVASETTVPASISNVPDPENYTITFNDDDTFNAKVDCNQVSGQYTTGDGGTMTITPGPSTMAACPEGSADALFLAALSGTTAYKIDAGQLVLTNADGTITLE